MTSIARATGERGVGPLPRLCYGACGWLWGAKTVRYFNRGAMRRPAVLDSERFRRANGDLVAYLNESDARRQRQRRSPADASLINNPEIKDALKAGFHGVCAYCEGDMSAFDFFDVEHHRPKFGAEDPKKRTDPLYYVWLTYDWDNLLPACRVCNSAKRNKFFVQGERGPLGASVAELRSAEQALFLDPCHDDIAEHLTFDTRGLALHKTDRGRATIEVLTLNRAALVSVRRQELQRLQLMMSAGLELTAFRTGLSRGWSSSILADRKGVPLPHAGALTLALLGEASRTMGDLPDVVAFLDRWREMSAKERQPILDALIIDLSASDGELARPGVPLAPATSNAGAAFRIERSEAAERPIRQVRIRNFKALASVDLEIVQQPDNPELAPCMMLLGENATGKSSVLEAIALTLIGTRQIALLDKLVAAEEIRPTEYVHRPDPANWDIVGSDPLGVDVRFFGLKDFATLSGDAGETFGGSEQTSKIVLGYGPRRYFPRHKARRFRAPAHRVRSLFDPMATIANPIGWLLDLRESDLAKFDAAARALRIILMLRDEALIEAVEGRVMIETPHGTMPLSKMSVGYQSVIAMAIDIIRELFVHYDNLENAYAVVLVDEIETHLHPRWKLRIVGRLRQAFPRVQFILTTHDPLCLRGMHQGEVFVLRRSEEGSRIEMLADLPDVQGMRAEQLLTSEFFGLGSTDPSTDAKVERYQFLAAKDARDEAEEAERLRLVGEIETQMTVGTSIAQQTEAEAARRADLDAPIALVRVESGQRRRMIEEALARLTSE